DIFTIPHAYPKNYWMPRTTPNSPGLGSRSSPLPSSHFLAFPLDTNSYVTRMVGNFQQGLINDKSSIKGFHETIVMDPPRLHITVGEVGLEDESETDDPGRPRRTVSSALALLNSLQPQVSEIIGREKKLEIELDALGVMHLQDSEYAHVLYMGPSVGGNSK
ncbi:unnamed protein product, partial [Rhizoctonia solani]